MKFSKGPSIAILMLLMAFAQASLADRFREVGTNPNKAKAYTEYLERRTAKNQSQRNYFFVDKTFTNAQKGMLERAVAKYFYRRSKQRIRNCALNNATRDKRPTTAKRGESDSQALSSITGALGNGTV